MFFKKKDKIVNPYKRNRVTQLDESLDGESLGNLGGVQGSSLGANNLKRFYVNNYKENREVSNMMEVAYISANVKRNAYVSEEISSAIKEEFEGDQELIGRYFDTKGRMSIESYEAYRKETNVANIQKSKELSSGVREFYDGLISRLNKKISAEKEYGRALVLRDFLTDIDDSYQLANNFAAPGSPMDKYSREVDIPVPVLYLYETFCNGGVKTNKTDGSVNKFWYKRTRKMITDEKMLRMFMCTVSLMEEMYLPQAEHLLQNLLLKK